MYYFEAFPTALYNVDGGLHWTLVTDIFKRVRLRTNIKENIILLDPYDIPDAEAPEMVSERHHGSVEYYWVILLINGITDPYHDWPKSTREFQLYVNDKYGLSDLDSTHHYEIYQDSGDTTTTIEVENTTYPTATPISNYEYEHALNENKRSISLLRNDYLGTFVDEFERLIN